MGLWPVFSLINHSCAPSGSYGLVGDVMVVRAARDMQAGEQVRVCMCMYVSMCGFEFGFGG